MPAVRMGGPQVVLVLGPHRSGTSALTRVLALLGARLPPWLVRPGADNPTGYWESQEAGIVHDRLLGELGRAWDDPRPLPPAWASSAAGRAAGLEIATMLDRWLPGQGPLALKDPRLCRLAPLWLDLLDEGGVRVAAVLATRPPAEVAASLRRRDGVTPEGGGWLWLLDTLGAERVSRGRSRCTVSFQELLDDQEVTCRRLAAIAGLHPPDGPTLARVAAFLDPSLRHHRRRGGTREFSPPLQSLLLDAEAALLAPAGPDSDRLDEVRSVIETSPAAAHSLAGASQELDRARAARAAAERPVGLVRRPSRRAAAAVRSLISRSDATRSQPAPERPDDVAFVLVVERGPLEWQSVLFVESLRLWGGCLRHAPVYAISPRPDRRPRRQVRDELDRLGARYDDSVHNRDTSGYGTVNRIVSGAEVERTTGHEVIAVVDSDTLVLGPLDALALRPAVDMAARPVDVAGISTSGPEHPMAPYWEALCRLAGADLSALPSTTATIDGARILANYNGGLVAVRRSVGILQRLEKLYFEAVAAGLRPRRSAMGLRTGAGPVSPAVAEIFGSAQAVLSVAAWTLTDRIEELPLTYNVPVHLVRSMARPARRAQFRLGVHVHYHWLLDPGEPLDPLRARSDTPLTGDQHAWLDDRLRWRDSLVACATP